MTTPLLRRLLGVAYLLPLLVFADYRESVGHTTLVEELQLRGLSVPTGTDITVTQVEAREDSNRNGVLDPNEGYTPDPADSQFGSVTLNDASNLGQDPSGHARTVGRNLYGSVNSMATGITQADVHESADWLSDWGSGAPPPTETNPLQNHSWVSFTTSSNPSRIMDFAVNRDGFLPVSALFNADFGTPPAGETIPAVYGSFYNGIVVGRSDGLHLTGSTHHDGSGRTKPEIVAPALSSGARFTSFVAPFVTAAAALLLEEAPQYGAEASEPETLKAILLAAASKEPFGTDWDQTPSRPIDEVFGAGELDVYESYWIQRAGQQPEGSVIDQRGWNFTSINGGGTHAYTVNVPAGFELRQLSALLTWNRAVSYSSRRGGQYTASLANLALRLKDGSSTLQASDSSVDNLEHIWRGDTGALAAGSYVLEVTSNSTVDYALAWRSERHQDYTLWSAVAFTSATPASERDPEDDPDKDGIANRLEQAFGGDPEAEDQSILPRTAVVQNGGGLAFEISIRQPIFRNGLIYALEVSNSPEGPWTSADSDFEATSITPSADPDFEWRTYRRAAALETGETVFVRVSVSP